MEDVVKGILSQEEINQLFKTANTTYIIVEPKKETTVKKAEGVSIRKALLQAKLYKGIKNLRVRIKGRLKDMVEKYNAEKREIDRKTIDKIVDVAAERLEMAKGLRPKVKTPEQMNYINAKLQEAGLKGVNIIDISLSELGIKTIPGINIERIKIPKKNIIGKFLMGKRLKNINIKDKEIDKLNKQIKLAKARGIENMTDISNLLIYKEKLRELEKEKIALIKKVFIVKDAVMKSSNFKPSNVKPVSENEPVVEGHQPILEVNTNVAGEGEKKIEEDLNSIARDGNYIKYTDNMGRQYSDYLPEEPVIDEPKPIVANKFDLEGELNNMFNKSPEVSSDKEETSFKDEFINNQKLENTEEISETPITLDIPEIKDEELTSEENQRLAEQVQNKYEKELHDKKQAEYDSPEYKLEMAKEDYRKILEDPNAKPEDIAYLKGYADGLAHQIAGPNQELLEEILYKVKSVEKNVMVLREESLKNHKDTLLAVTHSTKGESEIKPLEDQRQYIITSE
jgi:hypothetical protein